MKNKYVHAKTAGNITESIVEKWLQASAIDYKQENTMKNTRTRSKGGIDFEGSLIAIEVKKFTKLLTFKLKSDDHDIKWSQIEYLSKAKLKGKVAALLITEDNETFYFIHIRDFLFNWLHNTRKSINIDIANKIGAKCTNAEQLNDIIERSKQWE